MKYAFASIVLLFPAFVCFAQEDEPAAPPANLENEPYLGLSVTDYPPAGAPMVGWVLPGPLMGPDGAKLDRGDLLLAVNGEKVSAEGFNEIVRSSAVGDKITLTVRHTEMPPGTWPYKPGEGTREETFTVTLDAKATWSGPIAYPRPADRVFDPAELPPDPTPLEAWIDRQIEINGLDEDVEKIERFLAAGRPTDRGFHMLSRVAAVDYAPRRLIAVQQQIAEPLAALADEPAGVVAALAENLDLPAPQTGEKPKLEDPARALESVATLVAAAADDVERAFAHIPPEQRKRMASVSDEMLAQLRATQYVLRHRDPAAELRTLRASMRVDYGALLDAAAKLAGLLQPLDAPESGEQVLFVPLPEALRGAVEGPVLAAEQIDGRWYVYGSPRDNRYDMSRIDVVIDPAGDDVYRYDDAPRAVRVVLDFAGNDRHLGRQAGGPAGGFFGVSVLVDDAGDDLYAGKMRCGGAGVFGVGLLLDRAGNDTYAAEAWSQGVGFYGAGALIDLAGDDTFRSQVLSQAVGGPKGVGLLLDAAGEDLYRANGPQHPSVYGTPGVYYGGSQGFGFGLRMYDSGGIGILEDLAGRDRYEAGEFSQGGAYFCGLGVLHDRDGDDLYLASRYAQGFGCHQGHGILVDDAGSDTYYAFQVAAQGGSWDMAVGVLLDRAGDDSYQAEALSQGGASMQAFAWLIDLGGRDRYVAGDNSQAHSGGNRYHYDQSGAYSFSLLLDASGDEDAGGEEDFYSNDRPNNETVKPGATNLEEPRRSRLHGLFIDTSTTAETIQASP